MEMENKRYSQNERILQVLRDADYWVSAWDLSRKASVLCYTKRISELKREGYNIQLRWVGKKPGRHSEYRLFA